MSYADLAALLADPQWRARADECFFEQAKVFINDERAPIAGLATEMLRGQTPWLLLRTVTHAPGFADSYATGGQEAVSDADLLAATQQVWPAVAELLHTEPGAP